MASLKKAAKRARRTVSKKRTTKKSTTKKAMKKAGGKKVNKPASKRPSVTKQPAKKRTSAKKAGTTNSGRLQNIGATVSFGVNADVFRALCNRGDFEGPPRATREEARQDGAEHRAGRSGHSTSVIVDQAG